MAYESEFAKIEKKWQNTWEKKKAFIPKINKKQKKLFVTVPYPYTSGPLHIGHGRTNTIGDVYARFKRMQGMNVLWPMAFHITGTPILAVSRKIEQDDAEALSTYGEYISLYEKDKRKVKKILNSFTEPQKVADFFSKHIIEDFKSLGFSIDWSRRFTTGDPEYKKFVEWQFGHLNKLGLIKKGTHPVLYCINDKNAVGEDDIQNGDTIKPGITEFVLIKFELKTQNPKSKTYLVAATLRPDTIFGATNLFVHPDIEYVKFKISEKENWIGSREFMEKLSYQGKHPAEIEKISGKNLLGKTCTVPVTNAEVPVLPAKFPAPDIGSGLVYSVPGHSIYDYAGLEDLKNNPGGVKKYGLDYMEIQKIMPISLIKVEGFGEFPAKDYYEKFGIKSSLEREKLDSATQELYSKEFHFGIMKDNCMEFSGAKVSEAKEEIREKLIQAKVAETFQEATALELPVKCRCGGKIIASLLKDQWYINYGDEGWKEKTRDCLKKMRITPEMYRPLFDGTIGWLHERACARLRGLGTKLPWDNKWIIESLSDSTIYMAFYTIINLISKNKIKPEQLTKEFFDYVFLGSGNAKDVSKKTKVSEKALGEMRESFEYWYPVDVRHTAVGHITNHLTFFIFNHVAVFDEKHWPRATSLNEFLISEGVKMSKSKGNVVPLADISKKYGADLYRLYVVGGANLEAVFDWREKNIISVQKRLNRFYEVSSQITAAKSKKAERESTADLWLKSRFNSVLRQATDDLDNFRMRDYSQRVFFEFLNDLGYYFQRSKPSVNYTLLREILAGWLKILTPLIPHTAEEFWGRLGNKNLISLEIWPAVKEAEIRADVENAENLIKQTFADIVEIIKLTKKTPGKISLFIAPGWKYSVYNGVLEGKELKELMGAPDVRKSGDAAAKYFQKLSPKRFSIQKEILCPEKELEVLKGARDFFEKGFNCKFDVVPAENSENQKAKAADVMKPGILLE